MKTRSHHAWQAAWCVALGALCASAAAQTVYRCADGYSQLPCAGGRTLEAGDTRTPAQRAQSEAVARGDAQRADAMERARLKQEAQAARAAPPAVAPKAGSGTPDAGRRGNAASPQVFMARVPGKPGDKQRPAKRRKSDVPQG